MIHPSSALSPPQHDLQPTPCLQPSLPVYLAFSASELRDLPSEEPSSITLGASGDGGGGGGLTAEPSTLSDASDGGAAALAAAAAERRLIAQATMKMYPAAAAALGGAGAAEANSRALERVGWGGAGMGWGGLGCLFLGTLQQCSKCNRSPLPTQLSGSLWRTIIDTFHILPQRHALCVPYMPLSAVLQLQSVPIPLRRCPAACGAPSSTPSTRWPS